MIKGTPSFVINLYCICIANVHFRLHKLSTDVHQPHRSIHDLKQILSIHIIDLYDLIGDGAKTPRPLVARPHKNVGEIGLGSQLVRGYIYCCDTIEFCCKTSFNCPKYVELTLFTPFSIESIHLGVSAVKPPTFPAVKPRKNPIFLSFF